MTAVTICSNLGAPQNEVYHDFPIYLPWSDGAKCHDLSFLNVEFQASCFTLINRLFTSSLLSAIRVVSSAYLRLLIFLPAILIPACASSSPAFLMMYSAYNLNKQGDNIQPDVLLSWFRTSLLFYVQFSLLFLDLRTDFSGGRSGGLVFPSLSEFSTVYCDP